MHRTRNIVRASIALGTASIALFVALGGTAGASEHAAVPLAKRALVADNAMKLNGMTAKQLGTAAATAALTAALKASPSGPRPASTAAGLVVVKTGAGSIASESVNGLDVSCDAGSKVTGGGLSSDGAVVQVDNYPKTDTTWSAAGLNVGSSPANFTVYAVCVK
jgi:hypothetical protein